MEKRAACGIEEHQHDESCYEYQLTCGQEESDGHHHTDACYEQVLICGKEVHTHSVECYEDAKEEIKQNIDQDDNSSVSSTVTREEEEQSFTSGTLIAEGDGYRIIMDYPGE